MASINPHIIPEFSYSASIEPINGRHDRIMLDAVKCWRIIGPPDRIAAFREMLTGWSPEEQGGQRLIGAQSNPHHERAARWSIAGSTVEGESMNNGDPLIWGLLEAKRQGLVDGGSSENWQITARLALNPSKWISQQSTRLTMSPEDQWLEVPSSMFVWKDAFSVEEIPLVRSANVFVGMPRDLQLMRPQSWHLQIHRYVTDAIALLGSNLTRVAQSTGVHLVTETLDLRLKEVEIYWEFWSERPLEEMARIEAAVRSVAASSSTAWWPLDDQTKALLASIGQIEVGVEDNSPRLSLRLMHGATLRIYAKTNKRLRFEVAYRLSEARTDFRRRTFTSAQSLADGLGQARIPAAGRLGNIFAAIRAIAETVPDTKAPHELVSDIYAGVGTASRARDLVSMLVTCGRIAAYPNTGFHDDLVRLRRRGVLRSFTRAGNDFLWTVTPAYRAALLSLRSRRWNAATAADTEAVAT